MNSTDAVIWGIIIALGIGTYAMRFAFLGLLGNRPYPEWVLRLLRYAPHAVLPGILVPMLLPQDGASVDSFRLGVAALTLVTGFVTRNTLHALLVGSVTYFGAKLLGLA